MLRYLALFCAILLVACTTSPYTIYLYSSASSSSASQDVNGTEYAVTTISTYKLPLGSWNIDMVTNVAVQPAWLQLGYNPESATGEVPGTVIQSVEMGTYTQDPATQIVIPAQELLVLTLYQTGTAGINNTASTATYTLNPIFVYNGVTNSIILDDSGSPLMHTYTVIQAPPYTFEIDVPGFPYDAAN